MKELDLTIEITQEHLKSARGIVKDACNYDDTTIERLVKDDNPVSRMVTVFAEQFAMIDASKKAIKSYIDAYENATGTMHEYPLMKATLEALDYTKVKTEEKVE